MRLSVIPKLLKIKFFTIIKSKIYSPGSTPTKKPGFLPNLRAATHLFVKKTRFLGPHA